jgi:4-diphosphocytidyl-2-C-methyl-D-erythritol kinase
MNVRGIAVLAAVGLLALPALAGRKIPLPKLSDIAAQLGSDVPFFLLGGTAAAIGRGTELFPLPDTPTAEGVLVAPEIHVNTADAYRALSPRLTSASQENKIFSFQSLTWDPSSVAAARNDFEEVVFEQYPALRKIKQRLVRAGASAALMSGSGSSVFGLFRDRNRISRAMQSLEGNKTFRFSSVSRVRYQSMWRRALAGHSEAGLWPPQNRYSK